MNDPHTWRIAGRGLANAFHHGLGVGVGELPSPAVQGTDDLPPVFFSIPPLDQITAAAYAHLGHEVATDHRLSPEPLAQAGLADTCGCGQPAALCRVRRLMHRHGLDQTAMAAVSVTIPAGRLSADYVGYRVSVADRGFRLDGFSATNGATGPRISLYSGRQLQVTVLAHTPVVVYPDDPAGGGGPLSR